MILISIFGAPFVVTTLLAPRVGTLEDGAGHEGRVGPDEGWFAGFAVYACFMGAAVGLI